MDDRTRYETVKHRLRTMGEGTVQQVHGSMDDEMALAEQDEFQKAGDVEETLSVPRRGEPTET